MTPQIRLTCQYCDTDECDSVTKIPTDWSDVQEVKSVAASGEPLEWFTHIGICPACQIAVLSECSTSLRRNPMSRIRSDTDSNDAIAAALDRLCMELTVVRQVLDEIHEELEWANQNPGDTVHCAIVPRRDIGPSLEIAAPYRAEQVKGVCPAEVPDPSLKQRGQLF